MIGLVARGGMGKVYRAEDVGTGKPIALKILDASGAEGTTEFQKRFFLEAQLASQLKHPNNLTILDYGKTEDDIFYMAMEFLEGQTLAQAIKDAGGTFPEERANHIARQICLALAEAHALGAIHRDLKPQNVFILDRNGDKNFVKVLDFGLVKNLQGGGEELTQTGLFLGSPKYMAPEQVLGERVDVRTDIYALGILLFEMLCGKVPFDGTSVNILMAHVNEKPKGMRELNPAITVSDTMEETVARCIAKEPTNRYSTMEEVHASLLRAPEMYQELDLNVDVMPDSGRFATVRPAHVAPTKPAPALPHPNEPSIRPIATPPIAVPLAAPGYDPNIDRPVRVGLQISRNVKMIAGIVAFLLLAIAVYLFAAHLGASREAPPPLPPSTPAR